MKQSRAPILIILLLGLAAALYFIFTPTDYEKDSNLAEGELTQEISEFEATVPTQEGDGIFREALESEAMNPDLAESHTTQIHVIDPSGFGVPGARVIPWVDGVLQNEVSTDSQGMASIGNLQGAGGYAVVAENYLAVYEPYDFDGTPIEVHVGVGASLSGSVKFLREPTSDKLLVMSLYSSPVPRVDWLTSDVRAELRKVKASSGTANLRLKADGSFFLAGLPSKWIGVLTLPRGFMAMNLEGPASLDDERRVRVLEPTDKIRMDIIETPFFTGRLVAPDGVSGVADQSFEIFPYLDPESAKTMSLGARSDGQGFFRASLPLDEAEMRKAWSTNPESIRPHKVEIQLPTTKEWAQTELQLDLSSDEDSWHLGDLVYTSAVPPKLSIQVVDTQGQAIAGAWAYGVAMSEPTGQDGMTEVLLDAETKVIGVGARGFETLALSVPVSNQTTLKFVLSKAAQLHLSWDVPDGQDMSLLQVLIESDEHIFASEEERLDGRFRRAADVRSYGRSRKSATGATTAGWKLTAQQDGLTLWGIKPGVPMKISLVGQFREPLSGVTSVVLAPKEERDLKLNLVGVTSTFRCRVVDQDGVPVAGAEVGLMGSRGTGLGLYSDADGLMQMDGIAPCTVTLEIEAKGFIKILQPDYVVPLHGERVQFILERGRIIVAYLRDATGHIYREGYISSEGENLQSDFQDKGGFQIGSLPHENCTLRWSLGGARGTVEVPPSVEEVFIDVPVMASGSVVVTRTDPTHPEFVIMNLGMISESGELIQGNRVSFHAQFEEGELTKRIEVPMISPGRFLLRSSVMHGGEEDIADRELPQKGPYEVVSGQLLELALDY